MPERTALRSSTVGKVYVILALFIAIILCLVVLQQLQLDAMVAVRAFVGGEGLWAKAQKDAVLNLEHYALSRDEADYREVLRLIRVPLGNKKARQELQKERPDLQVAREGFLEGRNHPADMDCGIAYFRRFQRVRRFSHVIEHWTSGDRLISDLAGAAAAFHEEIASGRAGPETVRAFQSRLDTLNRK
ncbi:MAG: hypothetical protein HY900_32000, partial [Deltaproteobacteria bacterium]|nr:hypothetical protein [Deltaproteobacteria bacterium]